MGVNEIYEIKRRVDSLEEDNELIKGNHETLTADTQKLTETVDKLYHDVVNLQKAFPGDDAMSHRRYHELIIKQIEAKERLSQTIIEKTISGLVWSAIVAVGILLWRGLLSFFAKGF